MNISMHGKAIDYIEVDPMWTMQGNPERIRAGNGVSIALSATHHGDHDQFWIVVTQSGQEIARYNPRGVQHISWSPPAHTSEQADG